MRTQKQIDASRANGATSHGPTTPEGKATSARNATTHGLTAKSPIVLTVESNEAFAHMRQEYLDLYQPANIVERQILDEMASIQWRRQRGEALEGALIDDTMDRMAPSVAESFQVPPDAATRIVLAYRNIEDTTKSLDNIQRHNLRLSRQFLRLLSTLTKLQRESQSKVPEAQPEPEAKGPEEIEQIEPKEAQLAPTQQLATEPNQASPQTRPPAAPRAPLQEIAQWTGPQPPTSNM